MNLLQAIRRADRIGCHLTRRRLTRKYWARAIGAKKSPRRQLGYWTTGEWQPWGWTKYAWYYSRSCYGVWPPSLRWQFWRQDRNRWDVYQPKSNHL